MGIYAGLLAIEHGVFEWLQGDAVVSGQLIEAIGPPCQPEAVWHACFPALTLLPTYCFSGMATIFFGTALIMWVVVFLESRRSPWIMLALSLAMLLVGGGFVSTWIGLMASAACGGALFPPARRVRKRPSVHTSRQAWPWLIGVLIAWFPLSWLLGALFNTAMLRISGPLFIGFDVLLPLLVALTGWLRSDSAAT